MEDSGFEVLGRELASRRRQKRGRDSSPPHRSSRAKCGNNLAGAKEYTPPLRGGCEVLSTPRTDKSLTLSLDIGMFQIERSWDAFYGITTRLLRLDGVFRYWLYVAPTERTGPGREKVEPKKLEFPWSDTDNESFGVDKFKKLFSTPSALRWRWTIHIGHREGSYREWQANMKSARYIELMLEGGDKAYWYMPANYRLGLGTNQVQLTFRNAMECLLEGHYDYVVDWRFLGENPDIGNELDKEGASEGRLVLADESPSVELWDASMARISQREMLIKEAEGGSRRSSKHSPYRLPIRIQLKIAHQYPKPELPEA